VSFVMVATRSYSFDESIVNQLLKLGASAPPLVIVRCVLDPSAVKYQTTGVPAISELQLSRSEPSRRRTASAGLSVSVPSDTVRTIQAKQICS